MKLGQVPVMTDDVLRDYHRERMEAQAKIGVPTGVVQPPIRSVIGSLHEYASEIRNHAFRLEEDLYGPRPMPPEDGTPIQCMEDSLKLILHILQDANRVLSEVRERL